ncbi:MAG: hypothetical protein PWR31_1862 [Bacillota bacterium]|nr:hypothetical protein [Bacillota bacterium]
MLLEALNILSHGTQAASTIPARKACTPLIMADPETTPQGRVGSPGGRTGAQVPATFAGWLGHGGAELAWICFLCYPIVNLAY